MKLKRALGLASLLVLLLAASGLLTGWLWLRASLPQLDGERPLDGLNGAVRVQRDAQGVVTVVARHSLDLARATGFVHAQERFFQMDLLRRSAAGEVAALVGGAALEYDRARRLHDFRSIAENILAIAAPDERALLEAYAEGVNAGLASLDARPFEYGLLRTAPQPWRAEDSVLVIFAMYFDLHDETAQRERFHAALRSVFPAPVTDFLVPSGTEWDAPIAGETFATPPVPGPELIDLRELEPAPAATVDEAALAPGSNNWVVDDTLSSTGRPLLANDMHLGLGLPNIWFRMRLELTGPDGFAATGVTLPGVPAIVAGSNGRIAWGFTNSYGDWIDLVRLDTADCDDGYRTPEGCQAFETVAMRIDVAHGEPRPFEFRRTRFGPVVEGPSNGEDLLYALHWTAHRPEATNLAMRDLARAASVDEALAVAHRAGIPPQNFVVADAAGNIAWSIIGRIPRRAGHDGTEPLDSASMERVWDGWLAPEEYPVVKNPASGRLWTANARVVDGDALRVIGDGGYALGARAAQIRDRLFEQSRFDPDDMLRIQLDDEARFLSRWQQLLLDVLDEAALEQNPQRAEMRALVEDWKARASVDSVGYRMVRAFRHEVLDEVFGAFTARVRAEFPGFGFGGFSQSEGPLWRLVTERPAHLLPPGHAGWQELLLASADTVRKELAAAGPLDERTWGERNTVVLRHPLGRLPLIGLLINADPRPLPGDGHMPRVQGPGFGASERFVVSPGAEDESYFHMPGGQSGHPLSPFYLAGNADWAEGRPSPFLPGPVAHELRLVPPNEGE